MTTSEEQYDAVADQYLAAEELLIRTAAERPTFVARLGDVRGLECLDLACGSGFIARILIEQGARHVVGVDSSPEQIAVARQSTPPDMTIDYQVHDVAQMPDLGTFDIVTAAFLLNYSPTREVMAAMCERIAAHLAPGGLFVGDLPRDDWDRTRPQSGKYGVTYSRPPEVREGDEITLTLFVNPPITIVNRWWSTETYRAALKQAGFVDIEFTAWQPDDDAIARDGAEFWAEWTSNPLCQVVSARKAAS